MEAEVGAIVGTAVAVVVAVVVAGGLEKLDRAHNWSGFHQVPPVQPNVADEWTNSDGSTKWPPNDGAVP